MVHYHRNIQLFLIFFVFVAARMRTVMRCWQYLRWMSSVLSNCWVKTILLADGELALGGAGEELPLASDSSLSRKSKHSRTLSIVRFDAEGCEAACSF